jgi:nitrogen fixation protein FixH
MNEFGFGLSRTTGFLMQRRNLWPLLVISLIAGFLALSAWSFHRAARDASPVTDANYYSHGLRYNQTQLEHQAAASLGWQIKASLAGRQLQIILTDRSQQPVTAARGNLTLIDGTHGAMLELPLQEVPGGVYRSELPAALRGEYTAEINLELDGTRLRQRLLLALP